MSHEIMITLQKTNLKKFKLKKNKKNYISHPILTFQIRNFDHEIGIIPQKKKYKKYETQFLTNSILNDEIKNLIKNNKKNNPSQPKLTY